MSHGIFVNFIFSDFLWPDLDIDLRKHGLRAHALLFRHITSTLGEFDLFAAPLTDPRGQI